MEREPTAARHLANLEKLEREESLVRRRALYVAWGSVGAAAAILVFLVLGAQRELIQIRAERDRVAGEVKELEARKAALEADLKLSSEKLNASLGALERVPENVRKEAVDSELVANPAAAQVLPRVYVQIVDPADRSIANQIGRDLQASGVIALGTEYVPEAAGLKRNEVRYYKKSEENGAIRIVEDLRKAGIEAKTVYLNQEQNTKVRPNHYELWLTPQRRESPPAP